MVMLFQQDYFILNTVTPQKNNFSTDDEVAPNQLIDRLVDLMDPINEKKHKMTRKKRTKTSTTKTCQRKTNFPKTQKYTYKKT